MSRPEIEVLRSLAFRLRDAAPANDDRMAEILESAADEIEGAAGELAGSEILLDHEIVRNAEKQILDMIENSWKPREQRELAQWIVSMMDPETVLGLSADWNEANEERGGSR